MAAFLLWGLCIPGVSHGAGEVRGDDDPERLMNAVVRAASNCDFRSAWAGYQRGYVLMRDSPASKQEFLDRVGEMIEVQISLQSG